MSFQLLGDDHRQAGQAPSWLEIVVIVLASTIALWQYSRIYHVCKQDGINYDSIKKHFLMVWNTIEVLAVVIYLVAAVVAVWDPLVARQMHAAAFALFYFQLLSILSISPNLGPLLVAIGKMIYDITNFLLIFFVVVIGFGGAMYSAQQASLGTVVVCTDAYREEGRCAIDADLIESSLGSNLGPASWIVRAYFQAFGEFELTEASEAGLYPMILLIIYVMLTSVLLANLLIAMMGSTYDR